MTNKLIDEPIGQNIRFFKKIRTFDDEVSICLTLTPTLTLTLTLALTLTISLSLTLILALTAIFEVRLCSKKC